MKSLIQFSIPNEEAISKRENGQNEINFNLRRIHASKTQPAKQLFRIKSRIASTLPRKASMRRTIAVKKLDALSEHFCKIRNEHSDALASYQSSIKKFMSDSKNKGLFSSLLCFKQHTLKLGQLLGPKGTVKKDKPLLVIVWNGVLGFDNRENSKRSRITGDIELLTKLSVSYIISIILPKKGKYFADVSKDYLDALGGSYFGTYYIKTSTFKESPKILDISDTALVDPLFPQIKFLIPFLEDPEYFLSSQSAVCSYSNKSRLIESISSVTHFLPYSKSQSVNARINVFLHKHPFFGEFEESSTGLLMGKPNSSGTRLIPPSYKSIEKEKAGHLYFVFLKLLRDMAPKANTQVQKQVHELQKYKMKLLIEKAEVILKNAAEGTDEADFFSIIKGNKRNLDCVLQQSNLSSKIKIKDALKDDLRTLCDVIASKSWEVKCIVGISDRITLLH